MGNLNEQTVIRLPEGTAERARRIAKALGKDPQYEAVGRVSKSMVIRLALSEGLALLEKKYCKPDEQKKRG